MQVDEDFNIRFVKLVQKHKCLYDKKVPEYRNKDYQEKSWLEIAAETRESIPHCKERWRNLRACLSRYIKQQNSADPQHKPYYLTEHMQFVLPFLKSTLPSINSNLNYDLKSENNTNDRNSDPEETDDGYEDATQNNFSNFPTTKHQRLSDMIPTTMNCVPDVPVEVEQSERPEPEVMFMTSPTDRIQTERKRIKLEHYPDENSDMDFFRSVLPDISHMTALQKRKFKIGVLELIDDVLEKYPEKRSPHHPPHLTEIPNGYWRKS